MKTHIKNKAIKLRAKGYSYNLISEKLGIGKGTLSCWLKEIPFKPNAKVLQRIYSGPRKSGMIKHNRRVEEIIKIKTSAKKELGEISKRDLWMLGLGLYLGEGSKTYEIIRIINSDPQIIKLAIRWFKDICGLRDANITIAIHLYPDNDLKKCLNFWEQTTGLAKKQFRKTQIDKRLDKSDKKNKKLPFGTAHLSIISNGNVDFGVKLHRRIMGWMESSLKQI